MDGLWAHPIQFAIKCRLSLSSCSLSFGRFKDLRFVRTEELLAGKLPLQPHEYRAVIQKHCMEARQILLNKSVSGLRVGLCHTSTKMENSLKWTLVSNPGSAQFADFPSSLSASFHVPMPQQSLHFLVHWSSTPTSRLLLPLWNAVPSSEIRMALLGYRTVRLNGWCSGGPDKQPLNKVRGFGVT